MRVKQFRQIADEIAALYEVKDRAYGNSFGNTYEKLGIISAVTRISDKYNRLCNLATNKDIDNLGESLEDTLKDMAAYCIMTIMAIQGGKQKQEDVGCIPSPMNVNQIAGVHVGDVVCERLSELVTRKRKVKEIFLIITDILLTFEDGGFFRAKDEEEIKERFSIIKEL